MKRYTRNRLIGGLLAGTLLTMSFGAMASPPTTPAAAGDTVKNLATVNYNVGGVAQTLIESSKTGNSTAGAGNGSTTDFVVDDMLSLLVEKDDTSIQSAAPGNAVTLIYKVTNKGNAAQGAILTLFNGTAANDPFHTSGATQVNPSPVPVIHVDQSGTGNGSYGATEDTATSINTIPVNGSVLVFVTYTLPANGNNNDISVIGLKAQVAAVGTSYATGAGTAVSETSGAWNPDTEQYVFAGASNDAAGSGDADYDGKASAYNSALVVVTAGTGTGGGGSGSMKVTKTVSVVSDPTGATPAHAIPGAVMMYTITVANGGASDATAVSVSDSINAEVTAGHLAYKAGSITATIDGTAETTCTDAVDAPTPDKCSWTASSNTMTVDNMTVAAGKSAVVTFEVTIQQ